jgi:uncharacterized protein (DUF2235 family)
MPKRLVVCCDGTWNTADQSKNGHPCPTNVTRLHRSVASIDARGVAQSTYYHPGVGTSRWEHFSGGAFGVGLSTNVLDAYRYLIANYEPGDDLYFFGFSRGAFTARSIVGLVRNCGILRPDNIDRLKEAYALYRSKEHEPSGETSARFRTAYSHSPDIRFIGVWDTVGALGIPALGPGFLHRLTNRINRRWGFHDTELSSHVRAAFHAVAIDEQRSAFKPTLWQKQSTAAEQIVEQVWFAGVHCNVGGGLSDTSLADLALLWMVQKAQEHGLAFRPDAFSSGLFSVAPDPLRFPDRSRVGFYRLARAWDRPIGMETGKYRGSEQSLADSVQELRDKEPDRYAPRQLVAYLNAGVPRVTQVPRSYSTTAAR